MQQLPAGPSWGLLPLSLLSSSRLRQLYSMSYSGLLSQRLLLRLVWPLDWEDARQRNVCLIGAKTRSALLLLKSTHNKRWSTKAGRPDEEAVALLISPTEAHGAMCTPHVKKRSIF